VARAARGFPAFAGYVEPAIVNGAPGLLVRLPDRSLVTAFTVANGRIVAIDIIADPDKLRGLDLD
jgi:RNA polymerase sigma-70 factor (ECF subfamily)